MKKAVTALLLGLGLCLGLAAYPAARAATDAGVTPYTFPAEDSQHEGTWLIWPHRYTYGKKYQKALEQIWIEMVQALSPGERVHIVAYNQQEQARITKLLADKGVEMSQVDFTIAKTDDVWARDVGPIFVIDQNGKPIIDDFAFNGWGKKTAYKYDDQLASKIAKQEGIAVQKIPGLTIEGGSVELDGQGTAMLTKSSVLNSNRNPKMTQKQAESYLRKYLGVKNFIWLQGAKGEDITDAHIDGFARFLDSRTILTVKKSDFGDLYEGMKMSDYQKLTHATNAQGEPYQVITLPLTKKNVQGLDYKGSYLNYYVGNQVVLVPTYHDANDQVALQKLQKLYPDRQVVGIDVRKLYKYGGMLHCVTQQQPEF